MDAYPVFLSYASADLEHAQRIYAKLSAAGFRVWFDKARLKPGFNWHKEIEHATKATRVVLPVLTANWRVSKWTRYETYGAESVIPILVAGSWRDVSTPPLSRVQSFSLDLDNAPERDWQCLFASIAEALNRPSPHESDRIVLMRYDATPYFVGREDTLNEIHEKLFTYPTAALTQGHIQAVTAMGGVGKTTLARQYAEQYWRVYPRIFWVDCREGTETGFVRIHDRLRPEPCYAALPGPVKSRWALEELSQPERPLTLLVLDNADDQDSVVRWVPKSGNCHTLITSRFTAWTGSIEKCEVPLLPPAASRELLMRRSNREETPSECKSADELAAKLEYLPLALEQAAAFMAEQPTGFGFAGYLRLYEAHEKELLGLETRGATEYPTSVYLTWRATIDKLPQGARAMLRLHAFVGSTAFPTEIYLKGFGVVAQEAGQLAQELGAARDADLTNTNEFAVRNWLAALLRYSMVSPKPGDMFSVHGLVQAVERHGLSQRAVGTLEHMVELFVAQTSWASREEESRRTWDVLLPHAERLRGWAKVLRASSNPTLLERVAHAFECRGDYARAIDVERECVEEQQKLRGPDHPATLTSVNNLAQLLEAAGYYSDAEPLYRRVLKSRKRVMGKAHPDTLASIYGLAALLLDRAEYHEAETLLRQALRGMERRLGKEHPTTLRTVATLAELLLKKGNRTHSEQLWGYALEVLQRTLGRDHPQTLEAEFGMATLAGDRGEHHSAEMSTRRALETLERTHGVEHPYTLKVKSELAGLLRLKGDFEESESLYRTVLAIQNRVLGKEHPDTLTSIANLAGLRAEIADYDGAEPLLREAIEISERVLGTSHPETLAMVGNLGNLLCDKGEYGSAEPLYRHLLAAKEMLLGKEHPSTLVTLSELGAVLLERGEYAQAERLLRRALDVKQRVLGKEHPETLTSANNLAYLLEQQGDHDRAELLYRFALEGQERVLGKKHPDTLTSLNNLAALLYVKRDYEGAEPLYRRALQGLERGLGREHPNTLSAVNNLANLLLVKGDYEQAILLYRRALEGRKRIYGLNHPDTLLSANSLDEAMRLNRKNP
jgi:tetratricopeptide (TPR) repeat protein